MRRMRREIVQRMPVLGQHSRSGAIKKLTSGGPAANLRGQRLFAHFQIKTCFLGDKKCDSLIMDWTGSP